MLLSFAQFEREIAGERIRNKIAASKRKGMWAASFPAASASPAAHFT
jgi:DNA invertase Pin-like site-specific DNA recombinase